MIALLDINRFANEKKLHEIPNPILVINLEELQTFGFVAIFDKENFRVVKNRYGHKDIYRPLSELNEFVECAMKGERTPDMKNDNS